jgi:transposase
LADVIRVTLQQVAQDEATGAARMARPTYEDLVHQNKLLREQNRHLRQRLADLEAHLAQLEARITQLEQLLEKATRSNKRQAAPFSKGLPKDKPQKPGRKSGQKYGQKAHRPLPEQKPDEVIDVPLPEQCPHCGGHAEEDHVAQQFQVEIPRRAIVRRFDIHVGQCTRCGRRIQPRDAFQTSDATGAAASQLGPDLQALMAMMKDKYGLSYGDIQGLLDEAFGISVTRGGAAQVVLRVAQRSEPVYDGIRDIVRRSDTVYPDETGWKVGGRLQWMWVFVTGLVTLYVIRPSRGRDVPQEVLGADYDGRMIHDGWSPYDSFEEATHQQCLGHLLRRARALLERATRGAVRFPRKVKEFLTDALALRDRRDAGTISPHGLAVARGRLEKRLDRLLEWHLSHDGNLKFRNHLAGHADEILTFLYEDDIEATNWPAEQAIRPAVVNRKVFGGNRTPAGAHAQEVLGSLFATCAQQMCDALTFLSSLVRAPTDQRPARVSRLLPVSMG